jgi:tRNA pseudouridine38-40 synthase
MQEAKKVNGNSICQAETKTKKFIVQYDGTNYKGWQVQKRGRTIQGELEQAVSAVTQEEICIIGASRTDAGVHALGQVASFKTLSRLSNDVLRRAINAHLSKDIRIKTVEDVSDGFHSRFDAKEKTYVYIIANVVDPPFFLRPYVWGVRGVLNYKAMEQGLRKLSGEWDFSAFRASGCGAKNPIRTIIRTELTCQKSLDFMTIPYETPLIIIRITGQSFLRYMVRNIVGTLVEVGHERLLPDDIEKILKKKNRQLAGPTAPACGLFLEKIDY